jgi:hypothetical protein
MSNTIEYWRERAQKNGAEVLRLRAQLKEIAEALDPCLSLDELIDKISGIINREKNDDD